MTADNYAGLIRRLRAKTIAGVSVFSTPIELEAAAAVEALVTERDQLRAELARVSEQLEIALADLKQCQDMWAAQTKAALADGKGEGEKL